MCAGCEEAPSGSAIHLRLLAAVFRPFHHHRHDRLAGALRVLADHPVTADSAGASDWLPAQLAAADPNELTVVWHSVTQLYWPRAGIQAVDRLLATAHHHGVPVRLKPTRPCSTGSRDRPDRLISQEIRCSRFLP